MSGNNLLQRLSASGSSRTSRTATKQKLITGSAFNGFWLDPLQCMDGYGIYTFPDGSEYRGYFSRGYFNGFATLYLAEPHGFTFRGTFIDGHLKEIEDMWFEDGLSVNADIDGWSIDFSSWKYCTDGDRRYANEQREGLQPIGPFSMLTPENPPRKLHNNYYDVQEGIFNPSNGLIFDRPEPFPKIKIVSCPNETKWILKNCRHGPAANKDIDPKVCHKIIRNNLDSELEMAEHVPSCNYNQESNLKNYFAKLCDTRYSKAESSHTAAEDSEDSVGSRLRNSSSTCSSFCTTSMDIDVQEALFLANEYATYNLGHDLEADAPVLVKRHVSYKSG